MSPADAARFGVAHGDRIMVRSRGERQIIFADVIVRVDERFSLDFHIDTDEANAACLRSGDTVRMIGKNGEFAAGAGR
uniref:PduL/EutD family phosphate acyltransferase n=1 Tax=Gordoniibacillus kamchatkensis TaxID=1590651 RepID=UPI002F41745E